MTRQEPRPSSPSAWLWAEIARRFGAEAERELHQDYLAQVRVYAHTIRHTSPPKRKKPE